jgi:hypothetical protein
MRAFVFRRIGEVDIVKKPVPESGPNEAAMWTTTALVPVTTHEFGFDEIEWAFGIMESGEDGIIEPLIHSD